MVKVTQQNEIMSQSHILWQTLEFKFRNAIRFVEKMMLSLALKYEQVRFSAYTRLFQRNKQS